MKDAILELIKGSDWVVIKDQDNIKMLQIYNGYKVNIYWGKMTVNQLFKNGGLKVHTDVTLEQLRVILFPKKPSLWKRIKKLFKRK